jgi:hypothetical protein
MNNDAIRDYPLLLYALHIRRERHRDSWLYFWVRILLQTPSEIPFVTRINLNMMTHRATESSHRELFQISPRVPQDMITVAKAIAPKLIGSKTPEGFPGSEPANFGSACWAHIPNRRNKCWAHDLGGMQGRRVTLG